MSVRKLGGTLEVAYGRNDRDCRVVTLLAEAVVKDMINVVY